MLSARKGEPIFQGDKIVERRAFNIDIEGTAYHWTWFAPRSHAELERGPAMCGKIPANHAQIVPIFRRGETSIWEVSYAHGDTDTMFAREPFVEEGVDIGPDHGGVWEPQRVS